jgi:hypothetical protein
MKNRNLVVQKGKFEVKVEAAEEVTKISFTIPKQEEGINPDDYSYLIEHIMQLCMKPNSNNYDVYIDGVLQKEEEKIEHQS